MCRSRSPGNHRAGGYLAPASRQPKKSTLSAWPRTTSRPGRPGSGFFKPLRQIIESVNDTFKGPLDLERHGGHTPTGVITRVLQRILALTAAIWHNDHAGQPVMRSLIAYDYY